jgi:ribonuclease HI
MSKLLLIQLDSSTKATSTTNKYGPSTVAWTARLNSMSAPVVSAGSLYNSYIGPNKVVYSGIINALEACYWRCYPGDDVLLGTDCRVVTNDINSPYSLFPNLEPFRKQVKEIERKYRCPVSVAYVPRRSEQYYEVDQLAKRGHNFYGQNFGKTKINSTNRGR